MMGSRDDGINIDFLYTAEHYLKLLPSSWLQHIEDSLSKEIQVKNGLLLG